MTVILQLYCLCLKIECVWVRACLRKKEMWSQIEYIAQVARANFNDDPYVRDFGISVEQKMVNVNGRILPPPLLQYGGKVGTGEWLPGVANRQYAVATSSSLLPPSPTLLLSPPLSYPLPNYSSVHISAWLEDIFLYLFAMLYINNSIIKTTRCNTDKFPHRHNCLYSPNYSL